MIWTPFATFRAIQLDVPVFLPGLLEAESSRTLRSPRSRMQNGLKAGFPR